MSIFMSCLHARVMIVFYWCMHFWLRLRDFCAATLTQSGMTWLNETLKICSAFWNQRRQNKHCKGVSIGPERVLQRGTVRIPNFSRNQDKRPRGILGTTTIHAGRELKSNVFIIGFNLRYKNYYYCTFSTLRFSSHRYINTIEGYRQ